MNDVIELKAMPLARHLIVLALSASCACSSGDDNQAEAVTGSMADSGGTRGTTAGDSPGGAGGGRASGGTGGAPRSEAGRGGNTAAAMGGSGGKAGAAAAGTHAAGSGGQAAGTTARAGSAGTAGTSGQPAPGASGSAGSAGSSADEETCPLPTTFKWTSDAALAQPKNGWVSLKDFTHVVYNGKHLVYMTTHDQSNWGSALFTFDDWSDAASAPQTKTAFGVAPTLFYFTPKKIWVLAYQWANYKFSYRTSTDPSNPNSWSSEQNLYNAAIPGSGTGPIDQTLICDETKCYLYYAGDNGHIYKSSLPIDSFPGQFPSAQDSGIQGTAQDLFEAVQVYSVKGSDEYLMIVEAQGAARYFRAWTATDLEGPWTLLTDTFAAKSNVDFSTAWTNDISHGDLIRENPDETFSVDPCNLQMLFQGRDPAVNGDYSLLPYRPGLLTLVRE